jgi:hypothetical protein
MFLHLQFPFTDIRSFVTQSAQRISVPAWPSPIPLEEFVRSFGIVRERRNGGLAGWIGESAYCDAKGALLFPPSGIVRRPISASADEIPFRVVFRRLYFDGYAVGKIEIGLRASTRAYDSETRPPPIEDFIGRALAVPVSVRTGTGSRIECPLCAAGKTLAGLYAYSTSKVDHNPGQINPTAVTFSEAPMLFVELGPREAELLKMPRYAREVQLAPTSSFNLFFWRTAINHGHVIWVWCIAPAPHKDLGGKADQRATRETRNLRVYLLRLNAEHQALKRVLKEIGVGSIAPTPRDPNAQVLQKYLNNSNFTG